VTLVAAHESLIGAAAIRAAVELRVLERLGLTALDARGLADACGLSERGSRSLLRAVAALGVVEPAAGGRYRAAGGAGLAGPMLALYDGLAASVRSGRPAEAWDSEVVAGAVYPGFVPVLAELARAAADRAAAFLGRPGQRVLDVAAGAAPWSLAVAMRDPTVEVTALDLPDVVPETARYVETQGMAERYRFIAGDAFCCDLDGPYDLVLVANLCHLFDATANVRLLGRLRAAVAKDGRIAVIDAMPIGGRVPPPGLALYQLSLVLRTTAGAAHPFSAYVDWLTRGGYRNLDRVELDPAMQLTLVVATNG
jgi:2-polyprenyl-3-methyl-5-hydroxy-6-metoxy-1,4-benzoquinol methylase